MNDQIDGIVVSAVVSTMSIISFLKQAIVLHCPEWLSVYIDKKYLEKRYKAFFGFNLNLKNPTTFCEKLQWLKLYDRNPLHTVMVDKYRVKKLISDLIGDDYVIPQIGVYKKPEEIDFTVLPNQFVIKCNHNSEVIIVRDKEKIDENFIRGKLRSQLSHSHYLTFREWPYKNVEPCIIIEEYMQDGGREELLDYKFWCFNGVPKFCQVLSGHETELTMDFFDMEWNHMEFVGLEVCPNSPVIPERPDSLDEMKEISAKLALKTGSPFSRIDLYYINSRVYFGEITFFPTAGFGKFKPDIWNYAFANYMVNFK